MGSRILLWEAPELVKRQTRVVVFEAIQERWNNMGTDSGPWMTFDRVSKQLDQLVLRGHFSDQKKKNFENFYAGRIENLKFALGPESLRPFEPPHFNKYFIHNKGKSNIIN